MIQSSTTAVLIRRFMRRISSVARCSALPSLPSSAGAARLLTTLLYQLTLANEAPHPLPPLLSPSCTPSLDTSSSSTTATSTSLSSCNGIEFDRTNTKIEVPKRTWGTPSADRAERTDVVSL
eukprot:CAMPEP_0113591622 /NCGR_PEP_ID=MMETSP0015_2-20120614/37372_1 /TAXON_ID=2838 /ORGANISM="Odontella" /LENGTH=121 /DNA_ID=CAMNT_0000498025 /DNA_START=645 /DNA_END=1010 /DNA_ORIENTATION=- /assembly_acc=CAM_ASM_000160